MLVLFVNSVVSRKVNKQSSAGYSELFFDLFSCQARHVVHVVADVPPGIITYADLCSTAIVTQTLFDILEVESAYNVGPFAFLQANLFVKWLVPTLVWDPKVL